MHREQNGLDEAQEITASPRRRSDSEVVSLRPPAHRLSTKAIGYWVLTDVLSSIFVLAVQACFLIFLKNPPQWLWITLIITAVVSVVHVAIMPVWRYRVHRWEVTDKAVYILTGWIKQEWRIAPISRLQTIDIGRGPMEQLFGLAKVTITTASAAGPLRIQALDYRVALRLVDELTVTTQATRGDAT